MQQILVFLLVLCTSVLAGAGATYNSSTVHIGSLYDYILEVKSPESQMLPSSITFVGDVMLARRVETYLDTYGSDYVYSGLPILSSTTKLVGNFEASIPLKHLQTPDNTFMFSVDSTHLTALADYGFSYMSLANNHSFDYKSEGLAHTQKKLMDNDLNWFGDPQYIGTSSVTYLTTANATIALIGINTITQTFNTQIFQQLMDEASLTSDFQIVYVHWGTEYEMRHSKKQENIAYAMVDAGVDAIIGHHPHVVQDIGVYKQVPIFYSLGNFIFDQYFAEDVQKGLWLEMFVDDNKLKFQLQGITSIGSRSAPQFMSLYENDLFLQDIANKSTLELKEMIRNGRINQLE